MSNGICNNDEAIFFGTIQPDFGNVSENLCRRFAQLARAVPSPLVLERQAWECGDVVRYVSCLEKKLKHRVLKKRSSTMNVDCGRSLR